jgi:hypothetical protein
VLGLDIGGANLKASDGDERSVSRAFAMWREPERLADELRSLLAGWDRWSGLAVTMTAELADCFTSKGEGVDRILQAVEEVAAGREILVWQTGGEFVSVDDARELAPLVAAANWHALATWGARLWPAAAGLLIDIGSTTTDIIPLVGGLPESAGRTDLERLQAGELVYRGVRRTPLCAVAAAVELRDRETPLAAELFATTHDVFLLTGDLPEDVDCLATADGRPATRTAAHSRVAHMLCCDHCEISYEEAVAISQQLAERLQQALIQAVQGRVESMTATCRGVLLGGEGEFLGQRIVASIPALQGVDTQSLSVLLGPEHSSAACAFALARLAREL